MFSLDNRQHPTGAQRLLNGEVVTIVAYRNELYSVKRSDGAIVPAEGHELKTPRIIGPNASCSNCTHWTGSTVSAVGLCESVLCLRRPTSFDECCSEWSKRS